MSIQEHASISDRNGSALAKRASGLSLAVLLLGGILHATPITSVAESQLENSKQLASRSVAPPAIPAAVDQVTDNVLVPHSNTEASVQPATACILSSDCSTAVQVPEPQSLVLVGSGLLSMAGLIRRRLLR
jgi:hypothetical protein